MAKTLDDYPDHIITLARQSKRSGLWYAVLDVGPKQYASDPDFSSCAETKEEAIKLCAKWIRDDAKGIGRYAPHRLVTPCYDLHYRLMPHWESKEI